MTFTGSGPYYFIPLGRLRRFPSALTVAAFLPSAYAAGRGEGTGPRIESVRVNSKGISLAFAEMKDPVRREIERCELTRPIDRDTSSRHSTQRSPPSASRPARTGHTQAAADSAAKMLSSRLTDGRPHLTHPAASVLDAGVEWRRTRTERCPHRGASLRGRPGANAPGDRCGSMPYRRFPL
jgi:hypothetical protein